MSTFSTGISGIDPASENAFIIRFVLRVLEDASLHPEGSFPIASVAIFALLWLEVPKVLKDQDSSPVLLGKLHNASTYQMRDGLVCIVDLAPEVDVVLFTDRDDTGLASIASNPP